MNIADVKPLADRLRTEIHKAVVGQDDTIDLLLTALFAGGHILLEGPPGSAKTLIARTFCAALSLRYGRIQFTPDLTPGDILGSNLFNFATGAFSLVKGPIFTDLLLADEINRAPPKTQAALLEAMQERSITLDGAAHDLGDRFTVIATQNPIEQQGTYPLPEAQLDRFLFKHVVGYPALEEEIRLVELTGQASARQSLAELGIGPVIDTAGLKAAVDAVATVRLNEANVDYVVALIRATREGGDLAIGASPRAGALLARAARARAALDGRDFVLPDDIKQLVAPALRHRVLLSAAAEIEGRRVDAVLAGIVDRVSAPR